METGHLPDTPETSVLEEAGAGAAEDFSGNADKLTSTEVDAEQERERPQTAHGMEVPNTLSFAGFGITKLDGTNYGTWAQKVSFLLKHQGLWKHAEAALNVQGLTAEQREQLRERDQRALSIIALALDDCQLVHIEGQETAHGAWEALKSIYVRKTAGAQIRLVRKLVHTKLAENANLLQHIECMKRLLIDLKVHNLVLTEQQQACFLLSSLNSSYDNLITSLEALPEDEFTMTNVVGRLLEEYGRRQSDAEFRTENRQQRHQVTVKQPVFEPAAAQTMFTKQCYKCGSVNHLFKECPGRKPGKAGRSWQTDKAKPERKQRSRDVTLASTRGCESLNECYVVDSGSTKHLSYNKKLFKCLTPVHNEYIHLADGVRVQVKAQGRVFVPSLQKELHMGFVPNLKHNLLSVSALARQGFSVKFSNKGCEIINPEGSKTTAALKDDLFILDAKVLSECNVTCRNANVHKNCQHLFHRKFGHISYPILKRTLEQAEGVTLNPCKAFLDCRVCKQVKTTEAAVIKPSKFTSKKVLDIVYVDLIGPYPKSLGGARFVLQILDHFSRYACVYIIKQKSEAYDCLKKWLKFVKRKHGCPPACIVSDRGTEFTNAKVQSLFQQEGTQLRYSAPYRPTHNAFCERRGRSLQDVAMCLLEDSGLPISYWAEAMQYGNYLLNRTWHSVTGKIPANVWHGKTVDVSNLKIFGCKAYVKIPRQMRKKGQRKTRLLTFIGVQQNGRCYRFVAPNSKQVVLSTSAAFLEGEGWARCTHAASFFFPEAGSRPNKLCSKVPGSQDQEEREPDDNADDDAEASPTQRELFTPQQPEESASESDLEEESDDFNLTSGGQGSSGSSHDEEEVQLRRSQRERRAPDRYSPTMTVYSEPQTFKDIASLPRDQQANWKAAMRDELKSLQRLNVYKETDALPKGVKPVGSRWVYKIKKDQAGKVQYKARLVAQGCRQSSDSYDETFAATLRATSLLTVLSIAARDKMHCVHVDVKVAFLNAKLDHEVYMKKPQGLPDSNRGYWFLNKSLYGLKQSGHLWEKCLAEALTSLDFHQSKADPCVFTKDTGAQRCIVLSFVDDLAIFCQNKKQIDATVQALGKKFELRNLGQIKTYIGIDFKQTAKGYKLSQKQKIAQLLTDYGMSDCKPVHTPLVPGSDKTLTDLSEGEPCDIEKYQSLVGSLNYLANWTRPDISVACNLLSRATHNPKTQHMQAAKRVLRYLKHTIDWALHIEPEGEFSLKAYADASYASDATDRKSTGGCAVYIGNCLIFWRSQKLKTVSLSTSEAEYAVLAQLCNDLVYIRQLLKDLQVDVSKPVVVLEDNAAAISMALADGVKNRNRHTDIRYHKVRQSVQEGKIVLVYCETANNVADILTKPLSAEKQQTHSQALGVKG